jgi:hypothetical protein
VSASDSSPPPELLLDVRAQQALDALRVLERRPPVAYGGRL